MRPRQRFCLNGDVDISDDYAILLAEDDENDVLLTKLAFKKAGLEERLHVVKDGEEAIQYLSGDGVYANRKKYPLPNLLITDLSMPKKSGTEVIQWVRSHPTLKRLQVFILSGMPREAGVPPPVATVDAGATAYLSKANAGEDIQELVNGLSRFIEEIQDSHQPTFLS